MSQKIKSIYEELVGVTGFAKETQEHHQSYYTRVLRRVNALSDENWDLLSANAKSWANEAMRKLVNQEPVPDCPGIETVEFEEDELPRKRNKNQVEQIIDKKILKKKEESQQKKASLAMAFNFKPKAVIIATNKKNGKQVEGKFVEVDGDLVVLSVQGEETEFPTAKYEFKEKAAKTEKAAKEEKKAVPAKKSRKAAEPEDEDEDDEADDSEQDDSDEDDEDDEAESDESDEDEDEDEDEDDEADDEEEEAEYVPQEGDKVALVNKKGQETEVGTLISHDDSSIIVEIDGEKEEFKANKYTIKVVEKAADQKSKKSAGRPRGAGGASVLRSLICNNPELTLKQVLEKVRSSDIGLQETSIKIQYSSIQEVIKTLVELGWTAPKRSAKKGK